MAMLMRGEATLDEFRECYTGEKAEKFIRDGLMRGENGYARMASKD
jgi:hypothetical protein